MSGSSNLIGAACEACRAIWSLIDASEIHSTKEKENPFPLRSIRSHSLDRININEDESKPLIGGDSEKIVNAVTRAFLGSKAVQEAAAWSSVVSGGGDNTIISENFSILSLCASFDRDQQTGDQNNLKNKLPNPHTLICHSCLVLSAVAQSLKSSGGNSALFMLTSSPKKQRSRLSDLARHFSLCDRVQNSFQSHSMSAMLALASILSLEISPSVETSISEIAVPLIPLSATLCDYLRISTPDGNGMRGKLSYWNGIRDGCVGLLESRLRWGGPLAIQQLCASGIPQTLVDLLGNDQLSNRVISSWDCMDDWTVSSLCQCLPGGNSTFRQVLLRKEHVKVVSDLISVVHLKGTKVLEWTWWRAEWNQGYRERAVSAAAASVGIPGQIIQCLEHMELKGTARAVAFLAKMSLHRSLVVQVLERGLLDPNKMRRLLDSSSPREVILDILMIISELARMDKVFYEHIDGANILDLLKDFLTHQDPNVGIPGQIIQCLEHMELKGTARAVAFLAKMSLHRSLVVQVLERGLLDPNKMRRLLDSSSPREVILDILMIISELARMDKVFYEHIDGANILDLLKDFLTHQDPNVRAKACSAIGNMQSTKSSVCWLIGARMGSFDTCRLAYHSDEELRKCIPQLANLLMSAEEDNKTKANASGALSNLVRNSNKLSQHIVSKGAMQALLKLVSDCSVVALNPTRRDAINESPLKIALFSLAKMCAHSPCRQFLPSSELYPVIGRLRQSPESSIASYASVIFNRTSSQP
ncbi:unnamed protein product [Lactuca virosa]|uniref:non-specific serine/threonine protein kinase n=1 Tax=Lactuca virosa TaxID=75947 RepID=A0AAU9P0B5_9ASTR|nr:unnamed protein product [Lactuca virosa]